MNRSLLVDAHIAYAKDYISSQTGYLHYYFNRSANRHDTIPLFENFCYVLALFRTKQMENMKEAMRLLSSLLAFQTQNGGFPTYLHEYPNIRKPLANLQFLLPMHWIAKGFAHVLDSELRKQLMSSTKALSSFVETLKLPPVLEVFSQMLLHKKEAILPTVSSSKELSDLLLGMQTLSLNPSEYINSYTYQGIYVGPLYHELHEEYLPRVTMLDLFVMEQKGIHPPPSSILLRASLVQPFETTNKTAHHRSEWVHKTNKELVVSYLKSFSPNDRSFGFHLLRIQSEKATLVCQETRHRVEISESNNKLDLIFHYPKQLPEERGEFTEVSFYLSRLPACQVLVEGKKASLFSIEDEMTIDMGKNSYRLTLSILEGNATIVGELSYANRPSQIHDIDFQTFDWKISLRTVDRSETFSLKVCLEPLYLTEQQDSSLEREQLSTASPIA